ncbi:M56 family metallopeptidase [Arenibacter sp. M-2]|uniref:M56 family metallopeptidase n=1 Tax=Arenibacter sp. M-2 TaxID=3053612 RepID=UPI00257088BC|nr:M56 family metallopeptidase [Arenibacter sp. M-2]MDL5515064.1 M56 family metallopeptidase [Arenibacter sp. M-2]
MEQFLVYLLKSSGITALFLLFYLLVLKEETFFKANRIFLLTGLGISILLPLLIITNTIWLQPVPTNLSNSANYTLAPLENGINFDWLSLLFYLYIAGTFLLAMRFALQLFSLNRLIDKSIKHEEGKFIMVETDKQSSPFSFFRYIVYNPDLHSTSELKTILAHEKVHAEGRHSIDIIVMHLFSTFQWCNPFIWWYKACLDDNLEYLADTDTIAQMTNKTEYQYLLLRTSIGEKHSSLVAPFFNTSIKKRIIMLNQNRSERKNSFKYAFILPLLAGFTLLFNVKTIAQVKSLDSIQEDTKKYGPVNYDKEHSGDFPIIDKSNLQSPFYIGDTVPLYIVDGKKMSKTEFDKIEHNEIASINVYKSHQAIEKYGEEACNGVIELILKKE